jgi:hypothetical protein
MVLTVGWDRFAQEVRDRLAGSRVYAAASPGGCLLTAGSPEAGLLVRCEAPLAPADALDELAAQGLTGASGVWSLAADPSGQAPEAPPVWIAAVAYRTREAKPGCWMDAYQTEPTPAQVLQALYDEFSRTGQIRDVTFEDFLRLASPNVAVLAPAEVRRYAAEKPVC